MNNVLRFGYGLKKTLLVSDNKNLLWKDAGCLWNGKKGARGNNSTGTREPKLVSGVQVDYECPLNSSNYVDTEH